MKIWTKFGSIIAIACIAVMACLAFAPTASAADTAPQIEVSENTNGTTIIVTGNDNHVHLRMDRYHHVPKSSRSGTDHDLYAANTIMVKHLRSKCDERHAEHLATLNRWASEIRTNYGEKNMEHLATLNRWASGVRTEHRN